MAFDEGEQSGSPLGLDEQGGRQVHPPAHVEQRPLVEQPLPGNRHQVVEAAVRRPALGAVLQIGPQPQPGADTLFGGCPQPRGNGRPVAASRSSGDDRNASLQEA